MFALRGPQPQPHLFAGLTRNLTAEGALGGEEKQARQPIRKCLPGHIANQKARNQSSAEGRAGCPGALTEKGTDVKATAGMGTRIRAFTSVTPWPQWKILFSTTGHCNFACAALFGLEDAMAPLLGKRLVY